MAFDLSNEGSQTTYGPVPSGSEVMLELELLEPSQAIHEHKYVRAAQTGLLQIYCKFTVVHGTYAGVSFRQNLNLPCHTQRIKLTPGQVKACNIGGAQMKAMCEAANKSTKMRDVTDLNGLKFPARLRINKTPSVKTDDYGNERTYWNNELDYILTPGKGHYNEIVHGGEYITDGPVSGDSPASDGSGSGNGNGFGGGFGSQDSSDPFGGPDYPEAPKDMDQVPF